jgi:hypothetical protein
LVQKLKKTQAAKATLHNDQALNPIPFLAKPPSWGREPLALSTSHHISNRPPQAHPGHPTG